MEARHKRKIDFGNPVRNLVGQPHYRRKPTAGKVLNALLDALAAASDSATCWAPIVKVVNGRSVEWDLMFKQCPGACGHVWRLTLKNNDICKWVTNEINQRRVEAKS